MRSLTTWILVVVLIGAAQASVFLPIIWDIKSLEQLLTVSRQATVIFALVDLILFFLAAFLVAWAMTKSLAQAAAVFSALGIFFFFFFLYLAGCYESDITSELARQVPLSIKLAVTIILSLIWEAIFYFGIYLFVFKKAKEVVRSH